MNPLFSTVGDNLSGAWAIMRGRSDGLARLDVSVEGFWRSFGAIILVAPFAALAMLSQSTLSPAAGNPPATNAGGAVGIQGFGLLLDWIAFPLVFAVLARTLGLGARYVPFIVARNWGAVLVAAMLAILHALQLLGLLPAQIASFLLLVAIGVALRFSYMIARITLGVGLAIALPIVALDFLLSLTIWAFVDRLG